MELFEILPGKLWQSSFPDEWRRIDDLDLDLMIDLTAERDPILLRLKGDLYWPIVDGPELPDLIELKLIADLAAGLIQEGKQVLSHCAAGINRASLMNGSILYSLGFCKGPDIVTYLRKHRPGALTNQTFAEYLSRLA